MRKPDDPEMLAAREERRDAQLDVEILCKGIGQALSDEGRAFYPENVLRIIARVNSGLRTAVDRYMAAEDGLKDACKTYWGSSEEGRQLSEAEQLGGEMLNGNNLVDVESDDHSFTGRIAGFTALTNEITISFAERPEQPASKAEGDVANS